MARCPYGPHRLAIQEGVCRRCAGDVRLYAAAQVLPARLYNSALRLRERGEPEAALAVLAEALRLRPEFAEAHWLTAALEAGRGRPDRARESLAQAARLGAPVDMAWLEAPVPAPPALPPAQAAPGCEPAGEAPQ
jgi:hypothetical protein